MSTQYRARTLACLTLLLGAAEVSHAAPVVVRESATLQDDSSTPERSLAIFRGHSRPVNSISFSPDGKTLASAAKDTVVRLCDASIASNRK